MKYGFEWTPGIVLLGLVLILPLAPAFAMIGLLVVGFVAVALVVALAGAMLATPYLLVRAARRHFAEPRPSTGRPAAIVGVHVAALAEDAS
jgi:hypothetical protein